MSPGVPAAPGWIHYAAWDRRTAFYLGRGAACGSVFTHPNQRIPAKTILGFPKIHVERHAWNSSGGDETRTNGGMATDAHVASARSDGNSIASPALRFPARHRIGR